MHETCIPIETQLVSLAGKQAPWLGLLTMIVGARVAHSLKRLNTINPAKRLTANPIGPDCQALPTEL